MRNLREDEEEISSDKPADFETAIAATGFGKFNVIFFTFICIPSGWASMLSSSSTSYVIPVAECDLNLTLENKGTLNGILYMGMVSSGFLWGFLSDTLGRKKIMVYGYLLDAFFVFLAGISQTYELLLFSKFMNGFVINGPFAVMTTSLSEFHCAKYRARVLMLLGLVYSFANIMLPLLAWLILPRQMEVTFANLTLHSWNFFIIMCALPSLFSSVAHSFLPESPKFLMTMGKNKEALEIFKRIYSLNTGKPKETYPIKELVDEIDLRESEGLNHGGAVTANRSKTQALREGWQQIKPLFFPPHLARLCLVCSIQFGSMMGLNTLRLWLPQIFTAINDYGMEHDEWSLCEIIDNTNQNLNETVTSGECTVNTLTDSVYLNSMAVSCISILGYVITGYFINTLGKKKLLLTLGLISGVSGTCLYLSKNSFTVVSLSSMVVSLSGICTNILLTVIVDLFPTTLRTVTVSISMMLGRLGAMLGNLVFPYLLQSGCLPPFICVGSVIIICALLTILLPVTDLKALE